MSWQFLYDQNLKDLVTPKHLKNTPIHNWLLFPHSYSYELVNSLVHKWDLGKTDYILDPFCGAGTTLLAAKNRGLRAAGYDISPFAVFVSNVKTNNYNIGLLENSWDRIRRGISNRPIPQLKPRRKYPDLVLKALPTAVLSAFESVEEAIRTHAASIREANFFQLALFGIMPQFSRAKAIGGWLKWGAPSRSWQEFAPSYYQRVEMMLAHTVLAGKRGHSNKAFIGDIRRLPEEDNTYSAVITSPPYPNRHDYTRVFGVELLYGFLDWHAVRDLRYQSMHSHPESKPERPEHTAYTPPASLRDSLEKFQNACSNRRLFSMLDGYFVDIYCCLREIHRVCRPGANIMLALGNAQYAGVPFFVDELTAEIGEEVGLKCREIVTVRIRGNSSQQMKVFGRQPSRESLVFFQK